jgi:hypothetical protein
MTDAEYFLLAWAILSTVFAVFYHTKANYFFDAHRKTAVLIAELAFGEIKPVVRADGFIVVENEDIKMSFRRKDE